MCLRTFTVHQNKTTYSELITEVNLLSSSQSVHTMLYLCIQWILFNKDTSKFNKSY